MSSVMKCTASRPHIELNAQMTQGKPVPEIHYAQPIGRLRSFLLTFLSTRFLGSFTALAEQAIIFNESLCENGYQNLATDRLHLCQAVNRASRIWLDSIKIERKEKRRSTSISAKTVKSWHFGALEIGFTYDYAKLLRSSQRVMPVWQIYQRMMVIQNSIS